MLEGNMLSLVVKIVIDSKLKGKDRACRTRVISMSVCPPQVRTSDGWTFGQTIVIVDIKYLNYENKWKNKIFKQHTKSYYCCNTRIGRDIYRKTITTKNRFNRLLDGLLSYVNLNLCFKSVTFDNLYMYLLTCNFI